MKTLRLVAATALVSSVFALSASAAESEWWDVTFESDSFQTGFPGVVIGELGALTNDSSKAQVTQPYASGVWSMIDGDDSYVTNEYNPSGSFGTDNCLRLDTQGGDLTWTPTNENAVISGVQTLVDADLYLVGSDDEPTGFDENGDVQTAIYLKNYNDDEGNTTNSVLCVYVYDDIAKANAWVELEGDNVTLTDNSWAHVQVSVDHSLSQPLVSVKVGGTAMHAVGNASAASWPVANLSSSQTAGVISSVAFRGTGAVDNFVGKTVVEEVVTMDFTAKVYLDNAPVNADESGNTTRLAQDQAVTTGSTVTFEGFSIDNYESGETTYALSRIEIIDPADGTTVLETINYTYTAAASAGVSGQVTADKDDTAYVAFDPDFFDDTLQGGPFSVTAPSEGWTDDGAGNVIVKIYFTSLNEPQPTVPEVDVGEGLADYATAHPEADVPAPVAFDEDGLFAVSFVPPVAGRYVLLVSATVDGTYTEDADSAVTVTTAGEPVTLVESETSTTAKFFKIGFGE